METSAEQLHHGKMNAQPLPSKNKRLFIDLDICATGKCKDCVIKCSYYFHPVDANVGIISVAELATYALVCRRCEDPHCINSCPVEALEQQKSKDKLLIRHNMRCISCRSCSHACPYGTIYPENVPFLVHNCDFCFDRLNEKDEPLCIATCPFNALKMEKGDIDLDEHTFLVGDNLIVHSTHWSREKA